MVIQLRDDCTENQLNRITESMLSLGYKGKEVRTQNRRYLVCVGKNTFDIRKIGHLDGIDDIHRVSDAYKLVSSKWKVGRTAIEVMEGVSIGNGHFQVMAGPCSIESEEQVVAILKHLQQNNIRIMRGGAYKPRSSPYSFRGLGLDGLKMWSEHAREHGIGIISEVMKIEQIEGMYDYVDIFQVGARNTQNFNLLDALGDIDKPVLLKRGMSSTIDELLQSAEYIFSSGNERIILCERGIRTFETAYRNTLDLNAVAILREKSHLPVVADPSHGIGLRRKVPAMAMASVVAGADGLLVEIHPEPEKAFSDAQQTMSFAEAGKMYTAVEEIRKLECLG
jgi:3-deoxy-7-phosphoheptulonate synthase